MQVGNFNGKKIENKQLLYNSDLYVLYLKQNPFFLNCFRAAEIIPGDLYAHVFSIIWL